MFWTDLLSLVVNLGQKWTFIVFNILQSSLTDLPDQSASSSLKKKPSQIADL